MHACMHATFSIHIHICIYGHGFPFISFGMGGKLSEFGRGGGNTPTYTRENSDGCDGHAHKLVGDFGQF